MNDELESILRRVASGELTAEEAEPLVTAATSGSGEGPRGAPTPPPGAPPPLPPSPQAPPPPPPPADPRAQRTVRLQVTERGKVVVNLRIPIGLAGLAGAVIPGLSGPHADRVREAIRSGIVGPVLEVQDEDGDGVIISTE